MKHEITLVPGSQFSSPVIPAGPLEVEDAAPKRELRDDFMATLSEMMFAHDLFTEKEQRVLNDLIADRYRLNERAAAFIEQFQERSREKLLREHEAAKAAVRAQQTRIAKHKEEIVALNQELNRRNDRKAHALANLTTVQNERRQLSRFAERRKIEAVNLLVTKREAEADYATQQAGEIMSRINHLTLVELEPLQKELNALVAEEAKLNHYVTGVTYTTPEGIVVPGRPAI
jgi:hypothetical protein